MFYVDCNPGTAGSSDFYNALAHEFQYMINFNVNVLLENYGDSTAKQDTWINDGFSSAAEYIYDGHQARWIDYYNDPYSDGIAKGVNFLSWSNDLENYATGYLFFKWLRIQSSGADIYKEIISGTDNDYTDVVSAVGNDFTNMFAEGWNWENIIRSWFIANALCLTSGVCDYGNDPDDSVLQDLVMPDFSETDVYEPRITNGLYSGEGIYMAIDPSQTVNPSPDGHIGYAGISTTNSQADIRPVASPDGIVPSRRRNQRFPGMGKDTRHQPGPARGE